MTKFSRDSSGSLGSFVTLRNAWVNNPAETTVAAWVGVTTVAPPASSNRRRPFCFADSTYSSTYDIIMTSCSCDIS